MRKTNITNDRSRRFTEIDALLLSIWACLAFLSVTVKVQQIFALSVWGGALLIGRFFYSTVYLGRDHESDLAVAAGMPPCFLCFGVVLEWIAKLTPVTYDAQIAWLDHGASAAIRIWISSRPWAHDPLFAVYAGLPLGILTAIVATDGDRRRRLVYGLAIGGILAVPCYFLCPAVGPAHIGDPIAPRNCMPSMHFTWALLLWINLRGRVKYAAAAFALLTAIATIATGEHYLPDLVAALPWTCAIAYLGNRAAQSSSEVEIEELPLQLSAC